MFDANMRGLPKGFLFFADVCLVNPDSPLGRVGVKGDDVLLCEMLDDCSEDCNVSVKLKHETVKVHSRTDGRGFFLSYAGSLDGKDFIHDCTREKAKEVLLVLQREPFPDV